MADVVLKRHCKLLSFFYNNLIQLRHLIYPFPLVTFAISDQFTILCYDFLNKNQALYRRQNDDGWVIHAY